MSTAWFVMLHYIFAKFYHCGKLGKEYMRFLCILSHNCMEFNRKKKEDKKKEIKI